MSSAPLAVPVDGPFGPGSVPSRFILGMRVDGTSYRDATDRVLTWAEDRRSRTVCVASVNNVMLAQEDPHFLALMNGADLVTPDGMPLVWGLRRLGVRGASRVRGTDLTDAILRRAAVEGVPVGFLGGTKATLDLLISRMTSKLPNLQVLYLESPPFRRITEEEDATIARRINVSGARIVFVGLGCPKQELWMARQRGEVHAVMVGVGAAFDFLAGVKPQAPRVMQRSGLEWLFRLLTEPRRLGGRYLRQNPRFVALFAKQLTADRMSRAARNRFGEQEDG